MPLQEAQVLQVGAEGDVEGIARNGDRPHNGIDQCVAEHAQERDLAHSELVRLPDDVGRDRLRDEIAGDGYDA